MDKTSTVADSAKLVAAIAKGENVKAEEMLSKILAAKVDARYDEVMKKNG